MAKQERDPYAPDGYEEQKSNLGPAWPEKDNAQPGDYCDGVLKEKVPSEYGKDNYILTEAKVNGVPVEDGQDLMLWGSAVINAKLRDVQVGAQIRVVFTGTQLPKVRGQNPTKLFNVYVKK